PDSPHRPADLLPEEKPVPPEGFPGAPASRPSGAAETRPPAASPSRPPVSSGDEGRKDPRGRRAFRSRESRKDVQRSFRSVLHVRVPPPALPVTRISGTKRAPLSASAFAMFTTAVGA